VVSLFYLRKQWGMAIAIKEGHELIRIGPYAVVRHPMYFFMMLAILGSGLLVSDFLIIVSLPIIYAIYYARAKKEEELLSGTFPDYAEYSARTPMLVPLAARAVIKALLVVGGIYLVIIIALFGTCLLIFSGFGR
jgi:protein-S-isoprenylcysteine O-methyltransferase Ste14